MMPYHRRILAKEAAVAGRVVLAKVEALRPCVKRIEAKRPGSVALLKADQDLQEAGAVASPSPVIARARKRPKQSRTWRLRGVRASLRRLNR